MIINVHRMSDMMHFFFSLLTRPAEVSCHLQPWHHEYGGLLARDPLQQQRNLSARKQRSRTNSATAGASRSLNRVHPKISNTIGKGSSRGLSLGFGFALGL